MKTYISGQIAGLEVAEFKYNFYECQDIINHKYGGEWINPLDIAPIFGIKKWLFHMAADLYQLKKCTHIAM